MNGYDVFLERGISNNYSLQFLQFLQFTDCSELQELHFEFRVLSKNYLAPFSVITIVLSFYRVIDKITQVTYYV